MGGYLQLQNPLSGDICQCPVYLADPSFLIRNSGIKAFQFVIIHHAMMKRGVVVVQFHSFLNLRNRWKLKQVTFEFRPLWPQENILGYPLDTVVRRKNSCTLPGNERRAVSWYPWYLDSLTPSIYVMSDEYWANACSCCCGVPEGKGIFLLLKQRWISNPMMSQNMPVFIPYQRQALTHCFSVTNTSRLFVSKQCLLCTESRMRPTNKHTSTAQNPVFLKSQNKQCSK